MSEETTHLDQLVGKEVVIDVRSMYIFLGKLAGYDHRYVILEEADVHDLRDTNTTRERYVLESKIHGVKSNRDRVLINHDEMVCISEISDVIS